MSRTPALKLKGCDNERHTITMRASRAATSRLRLSVSAQSHQSKLLSLRSISVGTTVPPADSDEPPEVAKAYADQQKRHPFINERLKPQEWDLDYKDPLYRPKWRSQSKVISSDDFNARPAVGTNEYMKNLQDAGITWSYLTMAEQQQIYQSYVDLMTMAQSKYKRTSHEYVMRVLSQKYEITAVTAARAVTLQHNREKYIKQGRVLHTELAIQMEQFQTSMIDEVYSAQKLKKPEKYTEPALYRRDHRTVKVVDDVYDYDDIMAATLVREATKARLLIDGHIYKEDVRLTGREIPMSQSCKEMLKRKQKFDEFAKVAYKSELDTPFPEKPKNRAQKRDRWKFALQVVNVRELKRTGDKHRTYRNTSPQDTIIEQDGKLRAADAEDVSQTSWKGLYDEKEHPYIGPKTDWMKYIFDGRLLDADCKVCELFHSLYIRSI
jgi:hypothetical protein